MLFPICQLSYFIIEAKRTPKFLNKFKKFPSGEEKQIKVPEKMRNSNKLLDEIYICSQVGSFNYDNTKMVFNDDFIADESQIRSVLDYSIQVYTIDDTT